jgi:hypothetical protein
VPDENIAGMTMWLFIQAVGKKFWALLSCAAFTILRVWAEYFSKNNLWIVKASFVLAGLFLLVGCFLAWSDERSRLSNAPVVWLRLVLDLSYERSGLGTEAAESGRGGEAGCGV